MFRIHILSSSNIRRFMTGMFHAPLRTAKGLLPCFIVVTADTMMAREDEIARLLVPLPRVVRSISFDSFILVERSHCFKTPEYNVVRFIVHPEVKARASDALAWVREFLARCDTSLLGWLRIDFGREHRDRQGRIYYKFHGVYGRCWYPTKKQPSIRLSCQVPGPFPCEIITRKRPIYRNSDGTWPAEAKQNRGPVYCDASSQRHWKRVYAKTTVKNLNEGVVWVFAHETFHWLRKTGQIPGRNNEIEADAFADQMLGKFRSIEPREKDQLFQPPIPPQPIPVQCELFGGSSGRPWPANACTSEATSAMGLGSQTQSPADGGHEWREACRALPGTRRD